MTRREWVLIVIFLAIFSMGQFFSVTWIRRVGGSGQALVPTPNVQYLTLPTCPADNATMEVGSVCRDEATGENKQRDASGVKPL